MADKDWKFSQSSTILGFVSNVVSNPSYFLNTLINVESLINLF
jgi:hypothetical protein